MDTVRIGTDSTFSSRVCQLPLLQRDAFRYDEETGTRSLQLVGHRRMGKSRGMSRSIQMDVAEYLGETTIYKIRKDVDSYNPQLAYLASTQKQAKNIISKYLRQDLSIFPGYQFNRSTLHTTIPRPLTGDAIDIFLMAYRNHEQCRGMGFRKIYADELQLCTHKAFNESISSTLRDNGGALMSTGTATPIGFFKDQFTRMVNAGIPSYLIPATKTDVFTLRELVQFRAEMGEAAFQQEYLCHFGGDMKGAFYSETLSDLMADESFFTASYFPELSNILAVDAGIEEGFAAWVAQTNPVDHHRIPIIDFFSGYKTLYELREDLQEVGKGPHGLLPDVIVLPHDAKIRRMEAFTTRTLQDVFREVFPDAMILPIQRSGNNTKMAVIDSVQRHLHLTRFPPEDAATDAHIGLKLLQQYRLKLDADNNLTDKIDKKGGASHAADALAHLFRALEVSDGKINRHFDLKSAKARTPSLRRRHPWLQNDTNWFEEDPRLHVEDDSRMSPLDHPAFSSVPLEIFPHS